MDETKPCPFCGSANVTSWHYEDSGMWTVWCSNCKTEGPFDLGESGAVESWNTRPTEAAAVAAERQRVLRLVDALDYTSGIISWDLQRKLIALRVAIESGESADSEKEARP